MLQHGNGIDTERILNQVLLSFYTIKSMNVLLLLHQNLYKCHIFPENNSVNVYFTPKNLNQMQGQIYQYSGAFFCQQIARNIAHGSRLLVEYFLVIKDSSMSIYLLQKGTELSKGIWSIALLASSEQNIFSVIFLWS